MKYTKLGNSDLSVSRICMGCMGFGDAEKGQLLLLYDAMYRQMLPPELYASQIRTDL